MRAIDNVIIPNRAELAQVKTIAKSVTPKVYNVSTDVIIVGKKPYATSYRAFLEKRAAAGARGKSWLFVEHNGFGKDNVYRQRLTEYQRRGVVNRVDVAFDEKTSVEDKLLSKSHTIYEWIEGGAEFYVYGDANSSLTNDITNVLTKIVQEQARLSHDEANVYVTQLKRQGRFFSDVDLELGLF